MNEQQKQIPEPILDAFRKAAILDATAALKKREEEDIQERIDKLEAQLEAAREALGNVGRKRQAAVDDAEHYRYMAYGRASSLALPEGMVRAADNAALKAALEPAAAPVPAELAPGPQITAEDPLGLNQLDHTAALHIPGEVAR